LFSFLVLNQDNLLTFILSCNQPLFEDKVLKNLLKSHIVAIDSTEFLLAQSTSQGHTVSQSIAMASSVLLGLQA